MSKIFTTAASSAGPGQTPAAQAGRGVGLVVLELEQEVLLPGGELPQRLLLHVEVHHVPLGVRGRRQVAADWGKCVFTECSQDAAAHQTSLGGKITAVGRIMAANLGVIYWQSEV